jgi:plasmid stability protein
MPSLNIKNLPRELHSRLKQRAKRNHRSLNSEIVACLTDAVMPRRIDPDEAAERIRAMRERFRGPPLGDDELAQFKDAGRP